MNKRFDKKLWEENDAAAREAVKKVFKNSNFELLDNPKTRQVDILVFNKGQHVFNIETEIKRVWVGDFKYNTIQIPQRKGKLALLDKPTYYIMWNKDLTEYLVITGKDLLEAPLVEVPNKYVFKGEFFYQVPIKNVVFNSINTIKE